MNECSCDHQEELVLLGAFGSCPGTCDPYRMTKLGNSSAQKGYFICVWFLLDSLRRMLWRPCATVEPGPNHYKCLTKEVSPWKPLRSPFLCETFVLLVDFAAFLNSLSSFALACCKQSPFFYCADVFFITNITHKVNESPTLWRATCRVQWPSRETVQRGDKSGREASLASFSRQYKLQLRRRRSRCVWWAVSGNYKHLVLVSGCGLSKGWFLRKKSKPFLLSRTFEMWHAHAEEQRYNYLL